MSRTDADRSQVTGITGVTRKGPVLVSPLDAPADETWLYQLCLPFQAAPRRAAALTNIRKGLVPYMDFEVGLDLLLFDDPATIRATDTVSLVRSREEPNPHTTPPGRRAFISVYPGSTGFVPAGVKRADSSPHPHAGTGFAMTRAVAKDMAAPFTFANIGGYFLGSESYEYHELHQLSYEDDTLRVLGTETLSRSDLLSGWDVVGPGITVAIPDGDDLVTAVTGGKPGRSPGTGVLRWQRQGNAWRTVSFLPVPDTDGTTEPSLIRDLDGAWLLTLRGGAEPQDIRIWRSEDAGARWRKIIHAVGVVSGTPISINRAADGTPYVAANVRGWPRDLLCLWPVNTRRDALEVPLVARWCHLEFGPPRYGRVWESDHPSAKTVRLADGEWHNVLGYRILQRAEKEYGAPPSPNTGAYLEEVLSRGPSVPVWDF